MKARNTCPEETACIGMRLPVQSRTWTGFGGVDLVDVMDERSVGNREPGRLAGPRGQLDERRASRGDQPARLLQPAGEGRDARAQPIAGVAGDLLHDALGLHRVQEAGDGALRQSGHGGDVGHAHRPVGQGVKDRERPPDRLDSGHRG